MDLGRNCAGPAALNHTCLFPLQLGDMRHGAGAKHTQTSEERAGVSVEKICEIRFPWAAMEYRRSRSC